MKTDRNCDPTYMAVFNAILGKSCERGQFYAEMLWHSIP